MFIGKGEKHKHLLPPLAYCTEMLLKNAKQQQQVLVFRCDGMDQNKNVPQKVIKILKEKYPDGIFFAKNGIEYIIEKLPDIFKVKYLMI